MRDRFYALLVTILLLPLLFAAVFFMPITRYLQGYVGNDGGVMGER